MSVTQFIVSVFRRFLPSPFVIALLLSALTLLLAMAFGTYPEGGPTWKNVLLSWESGLWNPGLLVFAYQMMLILVLGHVVVLSRPMEKIIGQITSLVRDGASAALLVAVSTVAVAFFNWGLGLIFGAILARKVGEHASRNNIPLNYPLIGACGYLGLMVFNGGVSGSAAIKASEPGHITDLLAGVVPRQTLDLLPTSIPTADTIFAPPNLLVSAFLFVVLGALAFYLGKTTAPTSIDLPQFGGYGHKEERASGAERLDHSRWVAWGFGAVIFAAFLSQYLPRLLGLDLTPNMLNLFMLGLGVVLHGSISRFGNAVLAAIGGTSGILIQFPLYFGIMGVMAESGLVHLVSDFFVAIGSDTTYPLYTFLSAGLVNIFIPSGGGQWAVQGPIIMQAALDLGVSLPKALMALAYGDQLTNMLQPFWALPLLGITRLKAREILPYSLLFMVAGSLIFVGGLLLW